MVKSACKDVVTVKGSEFNCQLFVMTHHFSSVFLVKSFNICASVSLSVQIKIIAAPIGLLSELNEFLA